VLEVTIGIPVKPFPAAKGRLAAVLDGPQRAELGRGLAMRTVKAVVESGAQALILSADDAVTQWANSIGVDVLLDEGSSLNKAAETAVTRIRGKGGAWAILHADLPLLTGTDLSMAVTHLAAGRVVIAPSSDGGTSMLGASLDQFSFAYGAGSFHRHLAALAHHDPLVVTNRGLLLDLDTPDDLAAASGTTEGSWLAG
jgi:2-phospho-L-lactate/phosphoenolpyruvate guanylyltransferase